MVQKTIIILKEKSLYYLDSMESAINVSQDTESNNSGESNGKSDGTKFTESAGFVTEQDTKLINVGRTITMRTSGQNGGRNAAIAERQGLARPAEQMKMRIINESFC